MKSILISIKPKWCELIANGKKTIEVRKNKPKLEAPFKCYIYCTQCELLTRSHHNAMIYVSHNRKYQTALERVGNITLSGKVIGEFVCDGIIEMCDIGTAFAAVTDYDVTGCCLSYDELHDYGKGKFLYGWHISSLVIYDKPKELSELMVTRPPQSWCYAEEKRSSYEGNTIQRTNAPMG